MTNTHPFQNCKSTLFKIVAASCISLTLSGCGSETATTKKMVEPTTRPALAANQEATASNDITREAAAKFSKVWQKAVTEGNSVEARKLVMWERIVDNAMGPLDAPEKLKKSFSKGFVSNIHTGLIQQLKKEVANGGSYREVGIAKRGENFHVVFRLLGSSGGLNYHDFRLVKDGNQIKSDRLFIAATGEAMSDTLRPIAYQAFKSEPSFLQRVSGTKSSTLKDFEQKVAVMQAMRQGQFQTVLKLYGELTSEQKKAKLVQFARVNALGRLNNDAGYLQAMNEYEANFPNDPSLGLMMLDAAVMKNDPNQLEKFAGQLSTWVGGDPFLNLMVGSTLDDMGQVERAKGWFKDTDPANVDLAQAYNFDLTHAITIKDYDRMLADLEALRDKYGMQFPDLSKVEGFEGFAASEQFKKWKP